ncbi:PTS system cellobiose-specific IIC component [Lactobacillus colini]|uniref:Permease IIC component n=1 Tax=Lactobacillus colini TaxID=1819254 RepID=A0ABS4MD17_9LACO|nr:PTS transporter subunit EIIC [Lactobacillus colini]MBP2057579.1 PTS system cellobiose-specific IIC component [Lactobacillus colini]
MSRLVKWLETYILPLATKLGQIRWLVALRDTFISLLPITMAGSLAMLFSSLIKAAKLQLGWDNFYRIMKPLLLIDNLVWNGTFALFAIYFALSWGYHLAKTYEVNRFTGATIALVSFTMSISDISKLKLGGTLIDVKNIVDTSQFSTMGLFTAIVFGLLGTAIFILTYRARLTLKFSTNNMPHSEWVAFSTLIPSLIAVFSVAGINYLFQGLTRTYFGNWLLTTIQSPLIKMGQGFGMVLLITFLVQAFWFFGINGISVLTPVIDSLWLTPENINVTAVRTGNKIPYLWVRDSFNVFAWFGGAGGTLALIIAILVFSKRTDLRTVAKMALAPAVFNINEPVIFGLPVVFNPVYLIPFVIAPMVNVSLAYWVTKMGLVNPVQIFVPGVMPPFINSFLACNYDWRAIVLTLINVVIAVLIWMPFVFAADKIAQDNDQRNFYVPQY